MVLHPVMTQTPVLPDVDAEVRERLWALPHWKVVVPNWSTGLAYLPVRGCLMMYNRRG